MAPALLATKLHRPALPTTWIRRPYLNRRLDEGLARNHPVTLVSAPAGFGKTTCVSAWAATLPATPVAWLSLDRADDDPGRFFAYLIAALRRVDADLGRELEEVLNAGQLPPGDAISAILINEMAAREEPLLLVLDDVHEIQDPQILQVMEALVTNPPPSLRLVLLTREDPPLPLARLRANNRLTEIRARDLRFNPEDAGHFLNEALGLCLSAADVAALDAKTEGWIAGLQLAGLALQARVDARSTPQQAGAPDGPDETASAFIANLSGSHRFILDYLTEQVLDRQPAEVRRFLLQTAILDRLNGDLCDAVTGHSDSHAILAQLHTANLFLIPLDDEGRWYRYHHLFADLLRDRHRALRREEIAGMHRRAARWYAQTGEGAFAGEAIRHALAAGDYPTAAALLEAHAMDWVMQGSIRRVHAWLAALPPAGPHTRSRSPHTHLAFAWMHLLRGAYGEAAPYLDQVAAAIQAGETGDRTERDHAALEAEWQVMESLRLMMTGETTESMAAAQAALDRAPDGCDRVRGLAYYALGSAAYARADADRARQAYRSALRYSRAADNLVAEMLSTAGLATMAFEQGRLHRAYEIAAAVCERAERAGAVPPLTALVYGILGEICYQWHRLAEARRYMARTLQLNRLGGYNTGVTFSHVMLSRLSQLEGDMAQAQREIEEARALMPVDSAAYVRQELTAQQVRLDLARNRYDAAESALEDQGFVLRDHVAFPDLPTDRSVPYALGLLYNSGLRALLTHAQAPATHAQALGTHAQALGTRAQAQGTDHDLETGIALADRLIAGEPRDRATPILLEALLVRARMHAARGEREAGRAGVLEALALGAAEGFVSVFVEQGPVVARAIADLARQDELAPGPPPAYVAAVLAALAAASPADAPSGAPAGAGPAEPEALIEPLTDRELEVLALITEGLTYQEIGDRLFISLNTVRYHVKGIYGKLGVNNRTRAVKRARRLHLL